MQGFKTEVTQFRHALSMGNYVPSNDIHVHILTISHSVCSTIRVSATPPAVFDAGVHTVQRHALDMCMKETEVCSMLFLQN